MNQELPDIQTGFRKGRGTIDPVANIHWIIEKAREFQKTSNSALLTMPIVINKLCKILKEIGIPDHVIRLLRNLYVAQEATIRTRHGTMDWLNWEEFIKTIYCCPAYLTYMQSTSCKMLGWMKHKLESRLQREIAITSDMQMTPPLWQPTDENKRGE